MEPLPPNITIGDKYSPAMEMTDPKVAAEYFERCVQHTMAWGKSREEAVRVEKINFGYYAGYYSNETRARVEKLFLCEHPVFGPIAVVDPPTPQEAFDEGVKAARRRT